MGEQCDDFRVSPIKETPPEEFRRVHGSDVSGLLFGLAVGPLGGISVLLVILQPVLYDNCCTLCLATALISVLMIGPAMDEVLASLQYLRRVWSTGGALWRAFRGLEGKEAR